jgi:prophage regulatory protein
MNELAMWRLSRVKMMTGLGRSTIYRLMSEGKFPKSIGLTDTGCPRGWIASEIEDWLRTRIAKSRTR